MVKRILADAEAKKAALEAYIASSKAALALGTLGQPGDIPAGSFSTGSMGGPVDLPVGAFLGKSVPAAVKLYLSSVRKKQTTPQIAAALKEGGVESTASNFDQVVAGALFRLKQSGEVLRFTDGWGFAEHYPEHIRKAVTREKKPTQKKTKKAVKKTQKKSSNQEAVVVPITKGVKQTKGVEQRIEKILKDNNGKQLHPSEIAKVLNLNVTGVSLTLGRMAAKGTAEKCGDGKYRAPNETKKAV